MTIINKSYHEMRRLRTFEERYEYLKLSGKVGEATFGCDRIFNQMFYMSKEWLRTRDEVITRDNGCDLGVEGYDLTSGYILIHHINPITIKDIEDRSPLLFDLDNLITTARFTTHNAIHYGDASLLARPIIERRRNDTCPWRQ